MIRLVFLAFFMLCVSLSSALEYQSLGRGEARRFRQCFTSIMDAFEQDNYQGVSAFGPGILYRYASIRIQSNRYIKPLRPLYARLDSVVAFSLYRLQIDSLYELSQRRIAGGEAGREVIVSLDNLYRALCVLGILERFRPGWARDVKAGVGRMCERQIVDYYHRHQRAGTPGLAYAFIDSLHYLSEWFEKNKGGISSEIEEVFYTAMSSNDPEVLRDFQQRYPGRNTLEVNERIRALESDRIKLLLNSGTRDELFTYLNRNPDSPHRQELLNRLEPILFREALTRNDEQSCQVYLSRFSGDTPHGLRVSAILRSLKTAGYGNQRNLQDREKSYRILDPEYTSDEDQRFEGARYKLKENTIIPDNAMKKMLELGLIKSEE